MLNSDDDEKKTHPNKTSSIRFLEDAELSKLKIHLISDYIDTEKGD
jgi:hypothetical protein